MKKLIAPVLFLAGISGLTASSLNFAADISGNVKISLPAENARFKPGPGLETAQMQCVTCHSADYIYMQPRLTKEQWRTEVTKMKKVYGAPIPDGDVDTLVNYLMSQNGKQ